MIPRRTIRTLTTAKTAPAETSIPPAKITFSMPTETISSTPILLARSARFTDEKNLGAATASAIPSTSRREASFVSWRWKFARNHAELLDDFTRLRRVAHVLVLFWCRHAAWRPSIVRGRFHDAGNLEPGCPY